MKLIKNFVVLLFLMWLGCGVVIGMLWLLTGTFLGIKHFFVVGAVWCMSSIISATVVTFDIQVGNHEPKHFLVYVVDGIISPVVILTVIVYLLVTDWWPGLTKWFYGLKI